MISIVKHSVVRDDTVANELFEKGYSVIRFEDTDFLDELTSLYQRSEIYIPRSTYLTFAISDINKRASIQQEVKKFSQKLLDSLFKNYKSIINIFIIKNPESTDDFFVHQDPTAVDERRFSSVSLWCPLTDVNELNGTLKIIPGSHKLYNNWRGNSLPPSFNNISESLKKQLVSIELKKGEAILFDPRIIHSSGRNFTSKFRVVSYFAVVPEEAQIYTPHNVGSETDPCIKLIPQPEDYFDRCTDFQSDRIEGHVYEYEKYETVYL